MFEYRNGWVQRELNGVVWLEFDGVTVTQGRNGRPLDKVSMPCSSDGRAYPKIGQGLAMIGAMITIQQRSFTNTPMEERMLDIAGWVRELADVGPDMERVGEIAADAEIIWRRARGK